jgi:sugar lactone lactonase YvrE
LYVAQPGANTVLIYKQAGSGQSPSGSLTNDLSGPEGVFVAANHDLYVTDFNTSKIVVFKKGAKSPYKTLSDAGQEPEDPVVDTTGTVYVTNFQTTSQGAGSISVYAGGSKKPTSKLKVPNNVDVLWCALDNAHNLYVGYFSTSGPALGKFKNGGGKLIAVSLNFQFAGGLKFDSTQDLLLADQSAGTLNVYELPKKNPTKVISTPSGGAVLGVAFNLAGKDVYLADATTGAVYEYSYPSGTLINTITKGLNTTTGFPTGIATDPSAPF